MPPASRAAIPSAPEPPEPPGEVGLRALHIAYAGSLDDEGDLHGAALRVALRLHEALALELSLGARGGGLDIGVSRVEVPALVGLRLEAPIRAPIARLYGTVATGIALRTTQGRADRDPVPIVPIQVGAGLELGVPLARGFSFGVVFDVRLDVRVPIGELPPTVGPLFGAGLAATWY